MLGRGRARNVTLGTGAGIFLTVPENGFDYTRTDRRP